jgi:predicted nucleic acid-binding protein
MSDRLRVVFDCNVFLQALANPDGPAGQCLEFALTGKATLMFPRM